MLEQLDESIRLISLEIVGWCVDIVQCRNVSRIQLPQIDCIRIVFGEEILLAED